MNPVSRKYERKLEMLLLQLDIDLALHLTWPVQCWIVYLAAVEVNLLVLAGAVEQILYWSRRNEKA